MVSMRPVHTASDRRRFIGFPYALYRDAPYWIPPLRREQSRLLSPKRNPFFDHGKIQPFIATDESGRTVGRIAAIVNGMHLRTHRDGAGFFGFFECVKDNEVAERLLDAAEAWLREQGLKSMRGPTNPSLNETSGLLMRGFDRFPSIMMPYNPPYYADFLRSSGFTPVMWMRAYYGAWRHVDIERLRRGAELVHRRTPGLHIRKADLGLYDEEVKRIHELYNASFSGNWGHVPMTQAEFMHASQAMRPIVDRDFVFFIECNGTPIGFSLSLPNVNSILRHIPDGRLFPFGAVRLIPRLRYAEITEIRTVLLAVLPAFRNRGLDALLMLATAEEVRRKGFSAGEMSWVMEDNHALINALETFGCVRDKDYAIFERPIRS